MRKLTITRRFNKTKILPVVKTTLVMRKLSPVSMHELDIRLHAELEAEKMRNDGMNVPIHAKKLPRQDWQHGKR
jgi:hypothetical protein